MEKNEQNWSYSGETGPEHWGKLTDAFRLCEQGERQSPVDIRDPVSKPDRTPLMVREATIGGIITERRTTLGFDATSPDMTIEWENRAFRLQEFHFHAPSEHTLRGETLPVEGHFVHRDAGENALVLAVFLEPGDPSRAWRTFQERSRGSGQNEFTFSTKEILPEPGTYYAYDGSLTTPPCSQGVQWVLLEQTVGVREGWIASFRERFGPNNRPIQDLNGRSIYRYSTR